MLTLILGGARSGKSRFAQSICQTENVYYFATANSLTDDIEMKARIKRHQTDRPKHWKTIEESIHLVKKIEEEIPGDASILVDCITVWISNLMWEEREKSAKGLEEFILQQVKSTLKLAEKRRIIAVSNEVGSGIVPGNYLGRAFRDIQGLVNQSLAREAERVVLVIAGVPLTLKGDPY